MKKKFLRTGLLCAMTLVCTTCNKRDWDFFEKMAKKDCDVQSYYLSFHDVPSPFLFEKKYNAAGNRITEIAFSFLDYAYDARSYQLRLVYHGKEIYLVDVNNPLDTAMKIYLNARGRVKECFGNFLVQYTKFDYDAHNRLSNVRYSWGFPTNDTCVYDRYGNILRITNDQGGVHVGTFYYYDYSKKGRRQLYLDEPSHVADFTLLQYLGFFPELEPVHLRKRVLMGTEAHPYWWNKDIINHQFDAKGRLIRYDMVDSAFGEAYLDFQAFINWNCK